ncbi:MAG TPA: hypothetical protein VMT08_29240 [Bradyrhizobium sp.]|nr:hypothetical protein [Bradyrhizobium sp.]
MYEVEVAFLAKVEHPTDRTNSRTRLDSEAVQDIRETFPGIPEEYLAYLWEIGPGSVRECQYMIYESPFWCGEEPLFSSFNSGGRKLLVIGDNFSGDLFVLDAEHEFRVAEFLHETMEVWPCNCAFREFVRERMQLGPDGEDQRGRRPRPAS